MSSYHYLLDVKALIQISFIHKKILLICLSIFGQLIYTILLTVILLLELTFKSGFVPSNVLSHFLSNLRVHFNHLEFILSEYFNFSLLTYASLHISSSISLMNRN